MRSARRAGADARVPIVGALSGTALAGGMELLLHCHAIQAHAESATGLVQVGIEPAWGGRRELPARAAKHVSPEHAIDHCFALIRDCRISASALEAKAPGYLGENDGITMNRKRPA